MWAVVALISVAGAASPPKDTIYSSISPSLKSTDCGSNAYWDDCPSEFPPHQNCSLLWSKFVFEPDEDYCCEPACRCIEEFYRDDNFECVSSHQCITNSGPKKNSVKEVFEEVDEKKVCPANKTLAWCVVDCPYKYCPTTDSLAFSRCPSPRGKCSPGCVCQWNYKRLSLTNRKCILASECPPVKCTRPHEKWDSCPSPCYRENCEDRDIKPKICTYEGLNTCDPRCTCIEGYYRDQLDVCVPSADCAKSTYTSDLSAENKQAKRITN